MTRNSFLTRGKGAIAAGLISVALLGATPAMAGPLTWGACLGLISTGLIAAPFTGGASIAALFGLGAVGVGCNALLFTPTP